MSTYVITYRSKLGGSTIGIVFSVSAILYVAAFSTNTPVIGLTVLGVFLLLFLLLYLAISYTISRYELNVALKPFYSKTILISSITKIREVETPTLAPALSLKRLYILTKTGESVIVSPQNTQGFIRELKYRNPNIFIELD